MRVIELCGPSTGGIRAHVATLAADLGAAGVEVVVAAPAGVFPATDGSVAEVPVPEGLAPLGLVRAARRLRSVAGPSDVVHAHGLKAGWVALVARRAGVITVHNVVLDPSPRRAADRGAALAGRIGSRLRRRLERFVVEHTPFVIVTAPELTGRYPHARHVTVVRPVHHVGPPGRDAASVRGGLGVTGALVVAVARLHPQKGLDLLVAAASELPAGTTVVIAGEGPERAALEASVQPSGARVVFPGPRDDALDLLAAADVVVIPSRWESGPLVLLEALAVGAAVVTTDVGFVGAIAATSPDRPPFVVVDGRPTAIATAIAELLGDPTRRVALGEVARRVVRPFLDREPGVVATIALYRQAVRR